MKAVSKAASVLVRPSITSSTFPTLSAKTTVVLFGWAAAKDQHLAKHSKIYEDEGFTTLRYTSPFGGHRRSLKYARDVSGVVDDLRAVLEPRDSRLALHLFSMNGVYTLCSLVLQYPTLNILERSDGIVFDSCPVLFDSSSPWSFAALADTLARSNKQGGSVRDYLTIRFLLWKGYFVMGIYSFLVEQFIRAKAGLALSNFTPYHFLRDHSSMPRNLSFVYSDRDSICPPRTICEFHEFMKKQGHNVDVLRLVDSDHVEHFKTHPREYTEVIRRFLSSLEQSSRQKSQL